MSPTALLAIGLNYGRMAHCRAVVGYATHTKFSEVIAQPEDDGLYRLNLQDGSSELILSIAEVIRASGDERMVGKRTWFNHVLFNTDGTTTSILLSSPAGDRALHLALDSES